MNETWKIMDERFFIRQLKKTWIKKIHSWSSNLIYENKSHLFWKINPIKISYSPKKINDIFLSINHRFYFCLLYFSKKISHDPFNHT